MCSTLLGQLGWLQLTLLSSLSLAALNAPLPPHLMAMRAACLFLLFLPGKQMVGRVHAET